jgi:hypothetical protein
MRGIIWDVALKKYDTSAASAECAAKPAPDRGVTIAPRKT